MPKERLWTKDYLLLFMANFFGATVFYVYTTIIVGYSMDTLSADPATAGIISGLYIIGVFFGRMFGGKYIEAFGRKKLALFSTVLLLISVTTYLVAVSIAVMMFVRVFHGLSYGFSSTGINTSAFGGIPRSRLGEGTGMFVLAQALATAAGPVIGTYCLDRFGFQTVALICVGLMLCVLICVILANVTEYDYTREERLAMLHKKPRLSEFFELGVLPISLIITSIGLCHAALFSYMDIYSEAIGIGEYSGLFFFILAAVLCVARPVNGLLLDRLSDNPIMYTAFALYTVGFVLIVLGGATVPVYLIAAALLGLGYGSLHSTVNTIVLKLTPPAFIGRAISTFHMCYEIGFSLGPVLFGILLPFIGYSGVFTSLAVMVAATAVLYFFLHGRKTPEIYERSNIDYM